RPPHHLTFRPVIGNHLHQQHASAAYDHRKPKGLQKEIRAGDQPTTGITDGLQDDEWACWACPVTMLVRWPCWPPPAMHPPSQAQRYKRCSQYPLTPDLLAQAPLASTATTGGYGRAMLIRAPHPHKPGACRSDCARLGPIALGRCWQWPPPFHHKNFLYLKHSFF